jgi:hypothetical protein
MSIPTVLETLQTYVGAQDPVNARTSQNFHVFSTPGIPAADRRAKPQRLKPAIFRGSFGATGSRTLPARHDDDGIPRFVLVERTQRYGLPLSQNADSKAFSGNATAEDRELRKELTFGGPCFEGTLQKPAFPPNHCFRIKPRGRGD